MIPRETLVLLASLYEELEYAPDPTVAAVRRAELLFRSQASRLYAAEPPNIRQKMSLDKYIAAVVVPDVLRQIASPPPPASL